MWKENAVKLPSWKKFYDRFHGEMIVEAYFIDFSFAAACFGSRHFSREKNFLLGARRIRRRQAEKEKKLLNH